MSLIPKARNNFVSLSDEAAMAQVEVTAAAFEKDPTLLEGWPSDIIAPAEVKAISERLRAARNEARKGGKDRIEFRNSIRAELNLGYSKVVRQVEVMAIRDPQIIMAVGLEERKVRGNGNGPAMPKIRLSYGIHPGLILISAHRLLGASAYCVEYTYGDPLVEANWQPGCTLPRCTHLPVDNLQQGQRCYFRMRGIWASGPGPWSAVISIIVI
jgi:hypothetical protein